MKTKMNRHFVTAVFIWVCLSLIASESYACKTPPTARIVSPGNAYVCVGCSVSFNGVGSASAVPPTGSYDFDNGSPYGGGRGIDVYYWNYSEDSNWYEDGGEPNHTWDNAGHYWVYLYVEDDEEVLSSYYDYCGVYVVKVDKVVKWGSIPEETGPLYVGLEGHVYLEAIPYPEGASFPTGEPHWTIEDPPEGSEPSLYDFGSGLALLSNLNVPGDYIVRAKCGDDDDGVTITVTVVTVETLTWETYPDDVVVDPPDTDHGPNLDLGDNPNTGGGRLIFPGKKCYEDSTDPEHNEAAMRQKVKIKATLSAAPDKDYDVYVIFKCWDVDDPSSSTAPIDEDDDDPDPNKHSIDNNGSFYFEGYEQRIYVWAESSSNVVDANFYVSYQPGDNYRITATTRIVTEHSDITRYMVETGSLPSTVERSDMLTTWRKLWIERDYMAPVPSTGGEMNRVLGNADSCTYNQTAGETTVDLGRLLPYWLDDIDQFEGGWLKFTDSGNTYPVISSTHNRLFDDEVVVTGNCSTESDKSYILFDDDDQTLLDSAYYCSFASHFGAFREAYIEPNYLPSTYSDQVNFNLNLTDLEVEYGTDYDNEQDIESQSNFWACLVVSCYQGTYSEDWDPDGDPAGISSDPYRTPGVTDTDNTQNVNACCIFLETHGDTNTYGYSESKVVAHEVGHTGGADDRDLGEYPGYLMEHDLSGGDNFSDDSLNTFRSHSTWLVTN